MNARRFVCGIHSHSRRVGGGLVEGVYINKEQRWRLITHVWCYATDMARNNSTHVWCHATDMARHSTTQQRKSRNCVIGTQVAGSCWKRLQTWMPATVKTLRGSKVNPVWLKYVRSWPFRQTHDRVPKILGRSCRQGWKENWGWTPEKNSTLEDIPWSSKSNTRFFRKARNNNFGQFWETNTGLQAWIPMVGSSNGHFSVSKQSSDNDLVVTVVFFFRKARKWKLSPFCWGTTRQFEDGWSLQNGKIGSTHSCYKVFSTFMLAVPEVDVFIL